MIPLYYGSGSPYAWRVQLALEHKALDYERKVLSFTAGDTRKPAFLALNPRHRVPVIVDGDFVLYGSNAIVEYLDDAYAGRGQPLFPGDARERALVQPSHPGSRQLLRQGDRVVDEAFAKKPEERDPAEAAAALDALREETALYTRSCAATTWWVRCPRRTSPCTRSWIPGPLRDEAARFDPQAS